MSLVVKLVFAWILTLAATAQARDLNFLILGEGSAANCNEHRFSPAPNVFQLKIDGKLELATDPPAGAGCSGGSFWIPFGQGLIDAKLAKRVTFLSIAAPKASIVDWLQGGKEAEELKAAMALAVRDNVHFDYVLWQQGYSDGNSRSGYYYSNLLTLIRYVRSKVKVGGWIIAKGAGCPGVVREGVENAQERMGRLPLFNRFAGPDTSALDRSYGFGECGLNLAGQTHMAAMWVQAVSRAEKDAVRFQKEALLYYFR
jgi:hypothetical protein